jgi:DNA polymerase
LVTIVRIAPTFEDWRRTARRLLRAGVPPADVEWVDTSGASEEPVPAPPAAGGEEAVVRIPRRFLELAQRVAGHPSAARWTLLYGLLWRLVHEDHELLAREADGQVARLLRMEKEAGAAVAPARAPRARGAPPPAPVDEIAPAEPGGPGAAAFVPPGADLDALRDAARACRGCELHRRATQTVFGRGPADARIVLVGEQPGDQEDRQGAPFVGPAGEVLDRALAEAGLPRERLYVTNAVKHFSFVQRGPRRIHQKPRLPEVMACRPWLEAELGLLRPEIVVCLGATAASALLGSEFRVMRDRGRFRRTRWAARVLATIHPSAVLRGSDEGAQRELYALLVEDLRTVARAAAAPSPPRADAPP